MTSSLTRILIETTAIKIDLDLILNEPSETSYILPPKESFLYNGQKITRSHYEEVIAGISENPTASFYAGYPEQNEFKEYGSPLISDTKISRFYVLTRTNKGTYTIFLS